MKADTVIKAVKTAKKGGHATGRVGTGVALIAGGGTGAAVWGLFTGGAEIIRELFPPAEEEEEVQDTKK